MSIFPWITITHFLLFIFLCTAQWFHVAKRKPQDLNTLMTRWSENIPLGLFNRALSLILAAQIGIAPAIELAESLNWRLLGQRPVLGFFMFLLIMDFFFYIRHRFYHRLLWPLHQLHHEDEIFDATLSLRFHPVEIVLNILIYGIGTFICGANEIQAALASQVFAFQALFSHLDYKPKNFRFWFHLEKFIILPWNHETHHDKHRPHCNFGFLFSFWDRALGTWQNKSAGPVQLGVIK